MRDLREVPRWVLLVALVAFLLVGFLLARFTDGQFGPQGVPPNASSALSS